MLDIGQVAARVSVECVRVRRMCVTHIARVSEIPRTLVKLWHTGEYFFLDERIILV